MLKFRTMHVGADAMVDSLREEHGVEDLMFKLQDDPAGHQVSGASCASTASTSCRS